jgi:AcrR family transcriptional regulator
LSRRPTTRGADSRRSILDAALRLAAQRGYDGTSIALISQDSGLPVSSIYWHFDNKDQLLAEAFDHGMDRWRTRMAEVSAEVHEGFEQAAHDRFARAAEAVVLSPEFWHFGLMLSLEDRATEPAARARFRQAHADVTTALGSWWTSVLPAHVADPALGERLGQFHVAVLDGFYLAESRGDGSNLPRLAAMAARGVVAQVEQWERETSADDR